ncbi:uncharacterized protein LY89DRAFT_731593 [Mollisia scopiformis]|uniref:Uncharacterized protein n=1 Tax=Mollisia scopiformis TaxID=149040 RepID=A0A194XHD1_MOLSC|nr:uncharacterized protein LY89DRAFT_731593 [Mollisia scopiformis]KUJ19177.1 hypothetical protein LY89DRAFT_731593 [Mollisia scopiformis]
MDGLAGALGSVIGYLGAEVAEKELLERLLWPQRFYNDCNIKTLLNQFLLMGMGGPLHRAALATLDDLRDHGLYLGPRRGDMLGTAFYRDLRTFNFWRTHEDNYAQPKESRNILWIEVLDTPSPNGVVRVGEEHITARGFLFVIASEGLAVAVALISNIEFGSWWMFAYFCTPLLLKCASILWSVRREGLMSIEQLSERGDVDQPEIFELEDKHHGFMIIEGPAPVIQQFFGHYGHPRRDEKHRGRILADRWREVLSIVLVYTFVLYFPAGLLALLWMNRNQQYLWLSYQLYATLAMHTTRVLGWSGCGRTEKRLARLLEQKKEVWLQSAGGCTVAATLDVTEVLNMAEGNRKVKELIQLRSLQNAEA